MAASSALLKSPDKDGKITLQRKSIGPGRRAQSKHHEAALQVRDQCQVFGQANAVSLVKRPNHAVVHQEQTCPQRTLLQTVSMGPRTDDKPESAAAIQKWWVLTDSNCRPTD